MHEPLSTAIAVQPELFSPRAAADEIVAADVAAVPPAGLDAFGAGKQLQLRRRRIGAERAGLGNEPQRSQRKR